MKIKIMYNHFKVEELENKDTLSIILISKIRYGIIYQIKQMDFLEYSIRK